MKKASVIVILLMLGICLTAWTSASSLDKKLVPANSLWVIHFDMEQFAATRLGELLSEKNDVVGFRKTSEELSGELGIDVLEDIKGITLYGSRSVDEEAVILLTGVFDLSPLRDLLDQHESHQETLYGDYSIQQWGSSERVVFISNQQIILSKSEEAIKQALDVMDGSVSNITSSQNLPFLDLAPANAFLVAVADNVSGFLLGQKTTNTAVLKNTGMAAFMAWEENENLSVNIRLKTATPDAAEKVEQIVRGLIAIPQLDEDEVKELLPLLKAIQIQRDQNLIMLQVSYPSADLIQCLSGIK